MTESAVLLLGLGLGFRHATDPDHVVAVATLLQRNPTPLRALRVAAFWGLGHSASILAIGVLVVLLGWEIPSAFERATHAFVAVMLFVLGLSAIFRRSPESGRRPVEGRTRFEAPLVIGMVHGLAGSAAIALLVTATLSSALRAIVYLGLFGIGTILGMAGLTLLLSGPIRWSLRHRHAPRCIAVASGMLSVGLGFVLALELLAINRSP